MRLNSASGFLLALCAICLTSCRPIAEHRSTSKDASMTNSAITIFKTLAGDAPTPEDAFKRFFSWYEDVWLMNDNLIATMDTMPRPIREVAIAHQAFGYMSSEAPSGYYMRFEPIFDDEVKSGMIQLGFSDAFAALADGRKLFDMSEDGDLTIEQNTEIYGKLPSLEEIEGRIGRWLIEKANSY